MLGFLRRKYIDMVTRKYDDFIEQDISAVCISNRYGKILKVNTKFCQLFDVERNQILGLNVTQIMPSKYRQAHQGGIERHNKSGETRVIGKGEVELEGLKSNGEVFPIKLKLTKLKIFGEEYFSATINDLTSLKEKENLLESISRFPEENPGLILRMHKNNSISYANLTTKQFFKNLNHSERKRVLKLVRDKIDHLCEIRKPINEELQIAGDSYYVSFIPILDKFYFNVYAVKITDYINQIHEKEVKLLNLNKELNKQVEFQVNEIREKNKSLHENIRFARSIQDAIESKAIRNINSNYPAQYINIPHSVVSGDFIWADILREKTYILFGDCTGHGVSASLLTVMVNSLISQRLQPSKSLIQIMSKLRDDIILQTSQDSNEGINVGLDGALLSIDNVKNELEFCGANIPIYIQRAKELKEYSPNRFSLSLEGNNLENFESQIISLQDGDVIYIASDGIRDQFGGEKGKKLKKKGFENLLNKTIEQPFDQRINFIKSFMRTWKGDNFQVDDQSFLVVEYKSKNLI